MSSTAALALVTPPTMEVHSDLLGTLEVEQDDVITFADGIFGFPEQQEFVLVSAAQEGFFWLQSTTHGSLVFLLMDPFLLFDGYAVDLGPADLIGLGGHERSKIAILTIVTLPRDATEHPTANLQGPLAVNMESGRGKQLALQDSSFGVRCRFELPAPDA